MKSKYILLAIAVAGLAIGCSKKKAAPEEGAPEISVAKAFVDSVTIYQTYPGTLKAINTVDIVGRVNGTLTAQHFADGDLVQKGQVLFTIESSSYADAVQQAQAALSTALASQQYASQHYAALEKALKSDAVSQMEVNQARSALDQANASVSNARAALETARTNLSYCTIRAPFRGHVSAALLDPGAYVSGAGAPVKLATIYEDAQLNAEFNIDDRSMQEILIQTANGRTINPLLNLDSIPLTFSTDSIISSHYYGRLTYISPEIDPSTGTLTMRALVDNPRGDLHDGMYVTISLPSQGDARAVLVKDASISTDQLGKYLYTVSDSNKVVYTPVETGSIVLDSMRIIKSGIHPGELYVTRALLKVRDGMTIKPVLEP